MRPTIYLKRIFLTFVICTTSFSAFSQLSFQATLDSGKREFRRQHALYESDFNLSVQLLSEAVRLQPNNAEARYFLGYALDKLNIDDANMMAVTILETTIRASEQFEAVNRLEPKYKGELVRLDPYSKLTAVWGSQAFSYLNNNKRDSALWALKEGKRRGGFLQSVLEYCRLILKQCKKDAVLITKGDNITFSVLYLQEVEGLRPDVVAVDGIMMGAAWYANYIKKTKPLIITHSEESIDTTEYLHWEPKAVSIVSKGNNTQTFSWLLKPTYFEEYILRNDWMLMDILQHNGAARTFYFTAPSDSSYNLFLTDHLLNHGVVEELITEDGKIADFATFPSNVFKEFSLEDIPLSDLTKSPDALNLINYIRIAYLSNSLYLAGQNKFKESKELLQKMEQKLPVDKLPHADEAYEKYYKDVKSYIKSD